MKIGMLGTGDVGRTLGLGFASLGHGVTIGSRDPKSDKLKSWLAKAGPRTDAGTFAQAAEYGDVLVVATRWDGTQNSIHLAGPQSFADKVVIDVTNPLAFRPGVPPQLAIGHTDSSGETIQRWLPRARVVKAFNTIGAAHMVNPQFPGGPPEMFVCGNDTAAKHVVREICSAFGWPTLDIGGIEGARLTEPLAMLWITIGLASGSFDHAFKLLRK